MEEGYLKFSQAERNVKPSWSVENQGKSEMKGGYTDNGPPLSSMVVTGR